MDNLTQKLIQQSTKLLSLLLALVMAFSCMTVIGSARKEDVTIEALQYDSVDDAIISAEQGATIILNYLKITRVFLYWRTKNMEVIIL